MSTTKTILVLALCAGCGAGIRQIDTSKPANGGELTLHAAFSPDPARLSGRAIGEREVTYEETDTGACRGWVSRNPDHYMKLEDRFDYLDVQVVAGSDTTLVIDGPEGRFCSDDQQAGNRNPRVQGYFREGDYAIRIGTTASGETADYQIYFSQSEPM